MDRMPDYESGDEGSTPSRSTKFNRLLAGIGRRVGFKNRFLREYRFESCAGDQVSGVVWLRMSERRLPRCFYRKIV